MWLLNDGYRTHRVCFRPTGYTSPEQPEVVDHIDMATFNGGTSIYSTYTFLYNDSDRLGNNFHEVRLTGFGTKIED